MWVDTVPLDDPGALECDALGSEVVVETATLAEEPGTRWISSSLRRPAASAKLRGCGAVDQHVLVARARLASVIAVLTSLTYVTSGHCHTSTPGSRRLRTQIGTPSWSSPPRLEGPPAGDDRPRGHHLVEDWRSHPTGGLGLLRGRCSPCKANLQTVTVVAARVAGALIGPADNPSRRGGRRLPSSPVLLRP
jgi:hypothetical protein